MFLVEAKFRSLFWALFGVFLLYGTSMTILGALLPRILTDFHWDYVTAGVVMAGGGVSYFLSTYLSGYLVHHWGSKPTLLAGVGAVVVGLGLFGTTADPGLNLALNILIGLGQGGLEVTINAAVVRLDTRKSGAAMTFMQGAFAIGAIVGPLVLGVLPSGPGSWVWLYRGMAAVFAVLAVWLVFLKFDLPAAEEPAEGTPYRGLAGHPAYWLAFVVLLLYVGVELGLSNWVAENFVKSFAFDAAAASLMVSVFWAGILVGRFGVPIVFPGGTIGTKLLVASTVATLGVAALAVLPTLAGPSAAWLGVGAVFVAGLGCAVIYGLVLTVVGQTFPRTQSQAIGFAATGGGVGAFLFPFVGSMLAQAWGIQAGFWAFAAMAVVLTLTMVAFLRSAR